MSNLLVHDQDGVRILQFNRPEKRNAINLEMYKLLTEYLIQGEADSDIHAFLIRGTDDCFTSGNDIGDFLANSDLKNNHPAVRFLFCLLELKKPVVAAVSGTAVGIGTTLLLHCDLVYSAPSTSFQLPFVNLGLVPEAAATTLLPELIGHQKASELLLLGETFDAQQACDFGLINQIISQSDIFDFSLQRAKQLAAQPPQALQATRKLMRPNKSKIQHQMHQELEIFSERLKSDEAKAVFTAFLNKK